jgi:hypothetical protein
MCSHSVLRAECRITSNQMNEHTKRGRWPVGTAG